MAEAAAKKEAEAKTSAPAQAPAAKAKPDILSLVIFLLVSINLITVGGMGFFMQKMWDKLRDLQAQSEKLAKEDKEPEDNSVGKELQPANLGVLYPMESFLVNISSDQGPKFLQTQMELELADPAVEDEVTRKKAALRDGIIVLLSSRSYRELREPMGLKRLRTDLLKTINNQLSTGKVKEIYFTQFHFN